jgi:hypothetical protein
MAMARRLFRLVLGLFMVGLVTHLGTGSPSSKASTSPPASVEQPVAGSPPAAVAQPKAAKLLIVVTRATYESYEYGYFTVSGKIDNVGEGEAFSPTIWVEVWDQRGKTLLAKSSTWPAAHYLRTMEPGSSAAFETTSSMPRGPSQYRWRVYVDKYAFEVKRKK